MPSLEDIMVDPPPPGGAVVEPMAWFDSPGPFELEIGCGKGGFLLNRARANPHLRLLGIEWANKYYRYCADRMARWGITNVRVMRTDAKIFVINHLPLACLSVVHLYHPDPWPKKRHHKRRMVQPDFVEAVVRALVPGGQWFIQSDHTEYFEQIRQVIGQRPELSPIPWEGGDRDAGPDWVGTNYEIKYGKEGRIIYRVAYELTSGQSEPQTNA
jgi:tRNA (guanine-N7-)-methyltransferase